MAERSQSQSLGCSLRLRSGNEILGSPMAERSRSQILGSLIKTLTSIPLISHIPPYLPPLMTQWIILILSSLALFAVSPWARTSKDFFRGSKAEKMPGFWMLTSSLVISWLFAKSITNAANLGMAFGIVGGVAYAAYYLSFLVAGIIIYKMRVKGQVKSIHEFLQTKFGKGAVLVFSILIGIRLLNEVWSNTMVIGSYFGETGSGQYFLAIGIFTALTVAYTIKGGLRSSLLTDLIQMVLFGVLLFIILGMILPERNWAISEFTNNGEWTLAAGGNLLLVALLQIFSYPFHDPVLTDRAFISDPRTTLRSFVAATFIGGICIILFSFVGIYGSIRGAEGQAAVEVSKLLGTGMMLMMNFIMVTSAASTLDSAFNSFSKLLVIDLAWFKTPSISVGRWVIVVLAILGNIPILLGAEILSATTISGTMVIGLTPVFLFWNRQVPSISFYLSVGTGLMIGILLASGLYPEGWHLSSGKYADLLSANLVGIAISTILFWIPVLFIKLKVNEQFS